MSSDKTLFLAIYSYLKKTSQKPGITVKKDFIINLLVFANHYVHRTRRASFSIQHCRGHCRIFQHPFSHKTPKNLKKRPFENFFEKKSHNAEKIKKGDFLVSLDIVLQRKKKNLFSLIPWIRYSSHFPDRYRLYGLKIYRRLYSVST